MTHKPYMFNMCLEQSLRNLVKAGISGLVGGYLFWKFRCDYQKKKYAEFHANYDIDKEFERMKAKGLFTSC